MLQNVKLCIPYDDHFYVGAMLLDWRKLCITEEKEFDLVDPYRLPATLVIGTCSVNNIVE